MPDGDDGDDQTAVMYLIDDAVITVHRSFLSPPFTAKIQKIDEV